MDMKYKIPFAVIIISALFAGNAHANWQYAGNYAKDGFYSDDGSRFVLSLRGGMAISSGSIKNEIGELSSDYYINSTSGVIISSSAYASCAAAGGGTCTGYTPAGTGNVGDLAAKNDFSTTSVATGFSLGWTIPNDPQWRVELGWDHILETEYNESPLFNGDLMLVGGAVDGMASDISSGGSYASVTTDVISAMFFYDFFDGIQKQSKELIPYIGFGVGYADSKTKLILSDLYGDLSLALDLQSYGVADDYNILQFYKSEKDNANIAGLLALGVSYGISDRMFLDLGVRFMYIPKITWTLSDSTDERHRDWFSANDIIYSNVMLGVRFEF